MRRETRKPLFSVIGLLCITILSITGMNVSNLSAKITPDQKKDLNAIKTNVLKVSSLLRKKQVEEAEKALNAAEDELNAYVKAEQLAETEPALKPIRALIEKHRKALGKATGKDDDSVSFSGDVAPILAKNCLGCHGEEARGGLRLDTFAGMENGGSSGPLLEIGEPGVSLIMLRLTATNPENQMPKQGEPLSERELQVISTWISEGAEFDGEDKELSLDQLEKPQTKKVPKTAKKPKPSDKKILPSGPFVKSPVKGTVSFLKDVAPGFVTVCQNCHNATMQSGGFSVVNYDLLMEGGESGPVLTAGKLEESKLWKLLEEGDMPRGQARITREWYNSLKTWILEGCQYDGDNPQTELAKLIPTDAEMKREELGKLSPEEFAKRRLTAAEEHWKKTFPRTDPERVDNRDCCLFGDCPPERLQEIGKWAEEQIQSLRTTFADKEEPIFRGKIALFVFQDRFGYEEFVYSVHRREVPREIIGHAQVTPLTQEDAFIALQDVGDDASGESPGLQLSLMEQLASAYLQRDAKSNLPDWLLTGTGLALGAKAGYGSNYLKQQRRQVGSLLTKAHLETPEQVFQPGKFTLGNLGPVGLTLVEYLLQNGGQAKFAKFVRQVQSEGKTEDALRTVYGTDAAEIAAAYFEANHGRVTGKKSKK